jgi:hypothetical protein
MNNKEKFEQDLNALLARLTSGVEKEAENMLKEWFMNLQKENVVKINHSVMELVCAKYLILNIPVTEEAIRNARIQETYIIDVDQAKVQEIDPETYMKRALRKNAIFDYGIS